MELFDVYSKYAINLKKGIGAKVFDSDGKEYLDFYGGHGVISIGHSHPKYVKAIENQLHQLAFYTNVIQNDIQDELAVKLGEISDYPDYQLFLCNSGAEAVENALKLASFHSGANRVVALKGAFHGRTSGAIAVTDNPSIWSEYNKAHQVTFIEIDDYKALETEFRKGGVAAFIVEGIQGVGGVFKASTEFLKFARNLCNEFGVCLIMDEIQSGYGRTGKFFAHQHADIKADLITTAKGMGNGFPIAGVLISPEIKGKKGMLGSTYGGNHLACAAAIAVLDVMKEEDLIQNATEMGNLLHKELESTGLVGELRGKGLMVGIVMDNAPEYRKQLIYKGNVFTGFSNPDVIRLLPPLTIGNEEITSFLAAFKSVTETLVTKHE